MYTYKKSVSLGYADAVAKVRDELKKEGFGVLREIDIKQTLKTKLNVDFEDYIILGACQNVSKPNFNSNNKRRSQRIIGS